LLLAPGALTTAEQERLFDALKRSASMDDTAAAWALREAIDRVLLR
jgi:hypothetical protein